MRFLESFPPLLLIIGIGLGLYETLACWINKMPLKIRSVEELYKSISVEHYNHIRATGMMYIPSDKWDSVAHLPAPVLLFILSVIFYAIFRLLCLVMGIKPKDLYSRAHRNY